MRLTKAVFSALLILLLASSASAWRGKGYVYCDVNQDEAIDDNDLPLEGVVANVRNVGNTFSGSDATDALGYFSVNLPDAPDSYLETLDAASLPADAVIVAPPGGQSAFTTSDAVHSNRTDWLIDSATCRPDDQLACWLTAGGVKFEPVVGLDLATHGPTTSFGGNVNPGCSPTAGEGGQWNHVAHSEKLHFQGFAIEVVRCGNVPGIEPGSESPVTPFNFIEYQGTGRLKGLRGNRSVNLDPVYFFARSEDRNEPGSNGAKDGADVDRHFLHVYTDPSDPVGSTELLFDIDGDPSTVDPKTITGGNLQLHISSCDNPPL